MKRAQYAYLATVAIAAVAVATVVARSGVPAPEAFVVFALLAVGAELISVRLPNGATASALMVPVMGAVHVMGVDGSYLAGGLVAGFGGAFLPDVRDRRLDRLVFNVAQLLLAGVAAGAVYGAFDPAASTSAGRLLTATVPAGLAFLATNVILLVPMLALSTGRPVGELLRSFHPFHAQYIPFSMIGTALGWLAVSAGLAVVVFAAAPIVVARQTFRSYLALRDSHERTLRTLVRALEEKDPYTAGHVERVARYARYIGEELRLSDLRQERLRYAALMHDVGKLVISNRLLNKPDRLTPSEYEQVRLHEAVSVELLRRIDFLRPVAMSASPRYARYDASAGEQGPVEPYIIVVADAYDAMTTTRAYRKALSQAVAFAELRRNSGTQFHPGCVEALIGALERRGERHGPGHESDVIVFATPPPHRGPGSAGLGDLAPEADEPVEISQRLAGGRS